MILQLKILRLLIALEQLLSSVFKKDFYEQNLDPHSHSAQNKRHYAQLHVKCARIWHYSKYESACRDAYYSSYVPANALSCNFHSIFLIRSSFRTSLPL